MKKKTALILVALSIFMSFIPAFSAPKGYKVFEFDGQTLELEAEQEGVEVLSPWVYESGDEDASGGYMTVSSSGVYRPSITREETGNLRFHFNIPEETRYQIWIRFKATDTNSDSYFYRTDNANWATMWLTGKDEWQWANLGLELFAKGEHIVDVAHRELSFKVDKIVVTSLPDYNPKGERYSEPRFLPEYGESQDLYFNLPSITPPAGHPRVLLRKSDIPEIKKNLTHPQNIEVYEYLIERSMIETDGNLGMLSSGASSNMSTSVLECIEANAFLYLMHGDEQKGERAVSLAKNMITTLVNRPGNDAITRMGGQGIFVASLVYDWCYDLMNDEERALIRQYVFFHASLLEIGWPPLYEGDVLGHNVENQLNKDMLTAGIAFYDEDPQIYNVVAGRILGQFVPARNQAYSSFSLSEGPSYGRFRYAFELICAYLFKGMGYDNVYSPEQIKPAYGLLFARKPDGKYIPTGDDVTKSVYGYDGTYGSVFFMAGNLYKDSYIKREYYRNVVNGKSTSTVISDVSAVMHLIMNDVTVEPDSSFRDFPLTVYSEGDIKMMTARTSWDEGADSSNFMVQMNMQGYNYGNHQHMDAGHFDIYYKGALAIDSGIYESANFLDENGKTVTSVAYASLHDMNYHKRTVAHNSMLVYDPEEKTDSVYTDHIDGGQRLIHGNLDPLTLEDMTREENKTSEVLCYDYGPDTKNPAYSYIKADLSYAYTDKVEKYERSFMFLNFFDEDYPGALIVLDDITSEKAQFKKSWLLHSEEEPQISGNTTEIERTQYEYHGRLINETLLPANPVIEKIGGDEKQFVSNGTNFKAVSKTKTQEEGNWRIEISPEKSSKQDTFLNVLWVSDSDKELAPLSVSLIENTDDYAGVQIKDRVCYLSRQSKPSMKSIKIKSAVEEERITYTVTGLCDGKWTVKDKTGKTVAECESEKERNIISFDAPPGEYTLFWSYKKTQQRDLSFFANIEKSDEKAIDIRINEMFVSFENKPFINNGSLYLPYNELIERIYADYEKTEKGYKIESGELELLPERGEIKHGEEYINVGECIEKSNAVYVNAEKLLSGLKQQLTWTEIPGIAFIKTSTVASDSYNLVNSDEPGRIRIKKVTATLNSNTSAYSALDANPISYWAALGDNEWITFEFEKEEELSKLELLWNVGHTRVQKFELYVSSDNENWEMVFNGGSDGLTEGFETLKLAESKKCKYVKLIGHGNTTNNWNSLCEIHFFKNEE